MDSLAEAVLILERFNRIYEKQSKITFGNPNFPEQYAFIHSQAALLAALTTRRAGKSYAVGEKLFKKAMDYPGSTVLYLALTRGTARSIMWKNILPVIAKSKGIDYKPHDTRLEIEISVNESVIKLAGADADDKEKEKLLGGKYSYIAIDEAGSFHYDLEQLIYEYLEPCIADYNGSIDLVGTPTQFWRGFFCKVTESREPGWEVMKWNTTQNPFMPGWAKRLEDLKKRKPGFENTPQFKRMYLGLWQKDDAALVYKYSSERNLITELPNAKISGQVLGIDLGFDDATAYSLSRYYEHIPILYFIDAWKKSGQIIDDVINTIKMYVKKYDVKVIVIDNASKQLVESLKARFHLWELSIIAAEKSDKFHYIELMNSDFLQGRIKLLAEKTALLAEEYGDLIKDPNSKVPKEYAQCPNHLCDGSLYSWRYARNYMEFPEEDKLSEEDEIENLLEDEFHGRNVIDSYRM